MSFVARALVFVVSVVFAVMAARFGAEAVSDRGLIRRWFVPGALGEEPGRDAPTAMQPEKGFLTRAFSGLRDAPAQAWGQRNGLTPALAFSHNLTTVFPPKLFAEHPEYFPLADGKRLNPPVGSYFWNPDIAREDVARVAAAAAREHFDAHPEAPSFALGVNDALIWGESPELLALATPTKWFRERPDYSPVVFTFMNRAAAELSRTHPQKYLGALAYYWAENVPPFPLHPQVIPFLTADRSQGYDEAFREEEFELQRRWGALAGRTNATPDASVSADGPPPRRLGIYDYIYGHGFLIPRIHTRLIAEHLRHAHRVGFTDYFAEVNPNWGLDGPMPWLTAQLIRDSDQSPDDLLAEFYARYFREAAVPMRRFFERCEDLWMAQPGPSYWLKHYRNESQASVFPASVCRELRDLLQMAREAARSAKVAARVKLVSDTFGVTERFVRFHEARDRALRVALGRQSASAIAGTLGDYLERRRELVRYTDELRRAQPLALHPFDWSDYLRNDPLATALFTLTADEKAADAQAIGALAADSDVAPLWRSLVNQPTTPGGNAMGSSRELLFDAEMAGALQPPRMIAGLTYGVALPPGWQSKVEPAQFHRAGLVSDGVRRTLRIEGTKDTSVSQWVPLSAAGLHRAAVSVRGRVSSSVAVNLVFAFLDAAHRHVGFKSVRLPDGEWSDWVTLRQAAEPPPKAAWVGVGLRVQNQVKGDWVEARDFSLTAAGARE